MAHPTARSRGTKRKRYSGAAPPPLPPVPSQHAYRLAAPCLRGPTHNPGPPTAETVYEPVPGWAKIPHGIFLREATSVAVDADDRVYVFNRGNMPVMIFDCDGNLVDHFGNEDPFSGTVPSSADMYGNKLSVWPLSRFAWPHSVRIDHEGYVWLVDVLQHQVHKVTKQGAELLVIGTGEPAEAQSGAPFNRPTDVAVDPESGDVFISDGYRNSRVHRYDSQGRFKFSFGSPGSHDGEFSLPHNLALLRRAPPPDSGNSAHGDRADSDRADVGSSGCEGGARDNGKATNRADVERGLELVVCDRENHRVQVFSADDGSFRRAWHVHKATAVCVGRGDDDSVYVGEQGPPPVNTGVRNLGHRVSIFNPQGELLQHVGADLPGEHPSQFLWPHSVAVDSRGDLYVAEVSYAEVGRSADPPREFVSLRKWRRARN